MYLPKYFHEKNLDNSLDLIRNNTFATLISVLDGETFISHLPLILKDDSATQTTPLTKPLKLIGHLSTANPHCRIFQKNNVVKVIFHGPHKYITPKWYEIKSVPTWNYTVVHIDGQIDIIDSYDQTMEILKDLTDTFEKDSRDPWSFDLPDEFKNKKVVMATILAFEITVQSLNAKFKLSQNLSTVDRSGVIKGLKLQTDEMSHNVAKLMENSFEKSHTNTDK